MSASVGGYIDQVHLLVGLSRTITIAKFVEHVKTETSKWVKKRDRENHQFGWQHGYGAFSVSHSLRDRTDSYIRGQLKRHQRMTFQEEFRLLCEKHAIPINEQYVWD